MKKILVVSAACLMPALGFAADLPARGPIMASAPALMAQDWSGFYAGVHVGYGRGSHDTELLDYDHKSRGALGGVQVGYNVQFNQIVLGVEGDVSFSGIKANDHITFAVGPASSVTDLKHRVDYFATARARVGYAIGDALPYVTGGLAYLHNKSSATAVNAGFGAPFDGTFSGSDTGSHFGWVAGAGVEYAFTRNLSAKIEYLYMDVGKDRYAALPAIDPTERDHAIKAQVFRVGLNYRFGR
ncbi:MAG: hypothetical protein JWN07_2971 [Hyphomicrobiales bacterium]|nr:hypothetical protein [Hyphomicrobiales bacterium]